VIGEVGRVWRRGSAPLPQETDHLLAAAEEARRASLTGHGGFMCAMERGSSPDRPSGDEPGGSSFQPPDTPTGPQAPAPQPGAQGMGAEGRPPGQGQPPGPERPADYGGPVPPGGWEQPVATRPDAWADAPLSGWWRRVGAYILDAIFTALVSWVGVTLIYAGSEAAGVILVLAGIVVAFFYYPVTMMREGEHNGKSLGKQILAIRVVKDDGQPVTFGFALLREFVVKYLLFQVVGGFLFGIPWLIDVLWPLWDSENRALHDMIVKSHVVEA
jgi:uncharacterized RDD family membrane protein YckC